MPDSDLESDEDPWRAGQIPLDDQDREFLAKLKSLADHLDDRLQQIRTQTNQKIEELKKLQQAEQQLIGRLAQSAELVEIYLSCFDSKYGTGGAIFEIDENTWALKRIEG